MNIKKRLISLEKEMKDRKKDENLFVDPMILRDCHKIYGDGSPYVPLTNVTKKDFDKFVEDTLARVYSKSPEIKVKEKSTDNKPE